MINKGKEKLVGLNPDLLRVVLLACDIYPGKVNIIEGLRTEEQQKVYFETGKSQTMKSKHLVGDAVDMYPISPDGKSIDWKSFRCLADSMSIAAKEENVNIVWGGHWKSFKDEPHFELK